MKFAGVPRYYPIILPWKEVEARRLRISFLLRVPLMAVLLVCPVLSSQIPMQQSPAGALEGGNKPGVVVEKVTHNGEAETAGLQEGDILLSWSRGDSKGEIQSPFDIMDVETEQGGLGGVRLEGRRGTERQTWSLGPGSWGLTARPNFSEPLLSSYLQSQKRANSDESAEIIEATKGWRDLAKQSSTATVPWLATWLRFHNGEVLQTAKLWKEADEAYQSAIQDASAASAVAGAQILKAWANTYQQRNDWANAEKYLQQSMMKVEKTGSGRLLIGTDLNTLGTISWRRGDLGEAEKYYSQALEIRERLAPGTILLAGSFNNLGIVALQRGELETAERYFLQALDIKQKLAPGSLSLATSLDNLGDLAEKRGDLAKAEQFHRQALEIREKLAPGSLDVAASIINLGNVVYQRGDLAKAEQYYRRALEITQKLDPGSVDLSATLGNLGNVAKDRGDLAKAEQFHRQALEIIEKLAPGSLDVAASLNNLGNVTEERGDLAKAEQYYRQALEIREKLAPGGLDVAASLDNLGTVAKDQGDWAKAEQYHRQALEIEQKLAPDSLVVADSLGSLGIVAKERGDLVKAEQYHRQALEIWEKLAPGGLGMAASLESLATVAKDRGDLATAEQCYRQAVTIREKLAPDSIETGEFLADLATVLRDRQQPDVAAEFYGRAVSALESQIARLGGSEEVRSGFRAKHEDIYRQYIDVLVAQKQPERAFEVLERSRARVLLEVLEAAHLDIRRGADPSLLEQERSLRDLLAAKSDRRLRLLSENNNEKQLSAFATEIEDLEKQYQDVEERIKLNSPAYAALTQPQPLTANEIQHLLDADTVLIEYSLGDERSYVFAVTPDSLAVHELPKRTELESRAKHLYALLTARNHFAQNESAAARLSRIAKADAEYLRVASALSRTLLGSFIAGLGGKRLVIVGDGALQYVPFAALPTPPRSGKGTSGSPPAPLIADREIVELPSASVLAVLRQERSTPSLTSKQVVVFADPVFDVRDSRVRHSGERRVAEAAGAGANRATFDSAGLLTRSLADVGLSRDGTLRLPRLAFTRREAAAIVASAPVGMAKKALDFEANRILALSGEIAQYQIVHFATHALVDNQHPELSGLVLSLVDERGEPQNGLLDLQDIYNLDLRANLVVLSACDTALGKQVDGEGMIGLTRGFMYAGASNVMGTLWSVSDLATTELMKALYQAMERNRMPPSSALRQAQLALWKQKHWSAPYYWAAFTLQGDWN